MSVTLPPDYKPSDDEEFMNPQQLEYFRQKLLRWKAELVREANETLSNLTEQNLQQPDMADRAPLETEHSIELRTRDRERRSEKRRVGNECVREVRSGVAPDQYK